MSSNPNNPPRVFVWLSFALSVAVALAWLLARLAASRPTYAQAFAPDWLTLVAAIFAAAGVIPLITRPGPLRVQRVLAWAGLVLMIWAANGFPFDLLRVARLIPLPVDWYGLAIRTLALAAVVVLALLLLKTPSTPARAPSWFGYAAFACALPYPLLRTIWVFGGTLGLSRAGAGGEGWEPWLLAIPWLMAAALSLLLVGTQPWKPRRFLLLAGWTATAIVGVIGPASFWGIVGVFLSGGEISIPDMATWVPVLFYTSWFLFAIASAATTRSYQLRTAGQVRSAARPVTSPA